MKKKMIALAMAMAFAAGSVAVAHAFKCNVKSVQGTTVTLECKDADVSKIEAGQPIDLKSNKKKAAEGC